MGTAQDKRAIGTWISILLTLAIVAGALWIGRGDRRRLEVARQRGQALGVQAADKGLSITDAGKGGVPIRPKRPEVDAKALADEAIAMAVAKDEPADPVAAVTKLGREVAKLDGPGLDVFLASIEASEKLKEDDRMALVGILCLVGLNERPETALALFDRVSARIKFPPGFGAEIVPPMLEKWMARDFPAAMEWVRKRGAAYPEYVNAGTKSRMLGVLAESDAAGAFRMIGDFGITEPQDAVTAIMRAGKTPEQRVAVLDALRGYLAGIADERLREERRDLAMKVLARSAGFESPGVAGQWIAGAKFSAEEMKAFATGIERSGIYQDEVGKWIGIIASAGAEVFPEEPVRGLVTRWTKEDYRAAGNWVGSLPVESPARNASVRAYAVTVAGKDPVTAREWAMTLPEGEEREIVLGEIERISVVGDGGK